MSLLSVSVSKAGVALLAVASGGILAHFYGLTGLGIFALLRVAPVVFMAVTDPGFSHAVPYLNVNRKIPVEKIIGSGIFVYAAVGVMQIGLWLLFAPLIKEYLLTPLRMEVVYLASLLAPMQSITILIVNILRARFRYNSANSVFLAYEIVLVVLAGVFAITLTPDLTYLVYLLVLSSVTSLILGVVFIKRTHVSVPDWPDKATIIEGVLFGIKSQIGNAFQILNYRLDHLLLGFFLTPEKVAVYFVATKSVEFFRFLTASIVFVFEPIFAAQSKIDAWVRVKNMLVPLSLANLVLLSIGVLLAPLFYPLVFGEWAAEADVPLLILSVGLAISGANSLYGAYFHSQGYPGITTIASLTGLIFTIIFSLILIPAYEINGAAITSSLAYAAVTFTYMLVFFRMTRNTILVSSV